MKLAKRFAAMIVAVLMMFSLTSCSDTSYIAKDAEGNTVPVGAYIYYQYYAYKMMVTYGQLSSSEDLKGQVIGETDAIEYLQNMGVENVKYLLELEKRFAEAGFEISDSEKSSIENEENNMAGAQYAEEKAWYTKNGVSKDSVVRASLDAGMAGIMEEKLFYAKYGADGTDPITDDEIQKYYDENYLYISFISEPIADIEAQGSTATSVDEEIQAEVKARYEDLITKFKSGELDFDEYVTEHTEKGENYVGMSNQSYEKNESSEMLKIADEMEVGDVKYVEDNLRAYLIKKIDPKTSKYLENEDNTNSIRMDLKMSDFQNEILEAAKANTAYTINEAAMKKYSIKKLKLTV